MRLLLVEDDAEQVEHLKPALAQAGFAVDVADNGVDAEYLGNEEPYDIVVLDLGLPQLSGLEVLRHWRGRDNRVPVLILTARDAWHERVEGFRNGADDYLGKPFHVEELLARVQALVRRSGNRPGVVIRTAGLELDEERQHVTLEDGRVLELTGTEFRLLRYFMLNPERILSKSRITEHVYDQEFDRDSNLIEVYVRRLREKIGQAHIRTLRGQGYLFPEKTE
jgi:two-component system OmpR family response regulator